MFAACRGCTNRFRFVLGIENHRLETPDDPSAHKQIMLAAFSRIHVQLGHAGEKIPYFTAYAEAIPYSRIEARANLKYPTGASCFARVRSARLQ